MRSYKDILIIGIWSYIVLLMLHRCLQYDQCPLRAQPNDVCEIPGETTIHVSDIVILVTAFAFITTVVSLLYEVVLFIVGAVYIVIDFIRNHPIVAS